MTTADDFSGVDETLMAHYIRHGIAPGASAAPDWPKRVNLDETNIGRAYSNGWNECLSDCKRAFARAAVRPGSASGDAK